VLRSSLALGAILALVLVASSADVASSRERGPGGKPGTAAASPATSAPGSVGMAPVRTDEMALSLARLPLVVDAHLTRLLDVARSALQETLVEMELPPEQEAAKREARQGSGKPADRRRLKLVKTISGGLAPKSIVSDQRGRVYAMNMMYGHTISVFDKRYKRVKDISDSIELSKFGYRAYPGTVQGAPVEAAVSRDGKKIYVSNYSMYGPGFGHPGFDLCTPRDRIDRSFVYEISTRSLRKTAAIQVGEVPKYLAVTPDGRRMLVGNWCSWDISVVDLRKGKEVRRIEAGVAPRGIAYSPDGRTAYVTLVGEDRILVIDMRRLRVRRDIRGIGEHPRHLVMSPSGRYLYITSEGEDRPRRADGVILKYDTRQRRVVDRSAPLIEPRTTVMSDDGRALYVVDYHPGTIVKLATRDLRVIQERYLGYHPIGVTYDSPSDKVWVAGYGGQVWVLKDR
jgi:DNA-binding beta-propeller fold protein YncE